MSRVLVIDDDSAMRRAIRHILEAAGYTVAEAVHGRAGVTSMQADPPNLVITDIFMPEQEGIETIRTLRALSPETRIIAVSGDGYIGSLSVLEMARMFGAHQVIKKPFRKDELLRLVEEALADDGR